jgi:hypothetical protein
MAYKIRATFKESGRVVNASTKKFVSRSEAKEYIEDVIGTRRFRNFKIIKA